MNSFVSYVFMPVAVPAASTFCTTHSCSCQLSAKVTGVVVSDSNLHERIFVLARVISGAYAGQACAHGQWSAVSEWVDEGGWHCVEPINFQMTLTNLCAFVCVSFLVFFHDTRPCVVPVGAGLVGAALLSETLKTYNKTACDSENVTLSCPRGTSIVIETAQYAKNDGNGKLRRDDNAKQVRLCYYVTLLQIIRYMRRANRHTHSRKHNKHRLTYFTRHGTDGTCRPRSCLAVVIFLLCLLCASFFVVRVCLVARFCTALLCSLRNIPTRERAFNYIAWPTKRTTHKQREFVPTHNVEMNPRNTRTCGGTLV